MTHKALAAAVEQPSDVLLVGVLDRSHFFKFKNKRLPERNQMGAPARRFGLYFWLHFLPVKPKMGIILIVHCV